ncbi:MAG: choice-of-anchor tandem repeat GloVer-containing protein, partial [Methylocella sp.]
MHGIDGKRSDALWARGFAALWAALMAAAGGGALAAPTETVLHSFAGGSDGGFPGGGLIADSSGNLYGTTEGGSTRDCLTLGNCGTVFKLSPSGSETVLYAFTRNESEAGLIADSSGNLFGTIPTGGASICGFDGDYGFGCGVVFKLSPGGTYTELHSFTGSSDGAFPGGLIADSSGNLYGTTGGGGASGCGGFGCGGVFKLSPGGSETVLYSFTGGIDGGGPTAGLIADSSGNLYGTTAFGGSAVCGGGCGVVFKLSPGGTETVLHTLNGFPSDGSQPEAGLIADSSG